MQDLSPPSPDARPLPWWNAQRDTCAVRNISSIDALCKITSEQKVKQDKPSDLRRLRSCGDHWGPYLGSLELLATCDFMPPVLFRWPQSEDSDSAERWTRRS